MDTHFYKSQKIPKEKLRLLMKRSDKPAIIRFVTMFSLFLIFNILVVLSWNASWLFFLVTQLGLGIICCSMFAALHETGHATAFKSQKLNLMAARLAGFAHLYPLGIFRELHFTHHRHTHIPGKDPEISIGDKPAPEVLINPPLYLSFITGIPYLLLKINLMILSVFGWPEIIRKNLAPYIRPRMRKVLAIECGIILSIYIGLLLLAIYVNPGFWGIFLGQVIGHCLLSFYLVMEHNGCPHEGDILDRTRSVPINRFVKWIMWNMPYHAEHHAYPSVPFHALPLLHEELKEELKHKNETRPELHLKAVKHFFNLGS